MPEPRSSARERASQVARGRTLAPGSRPGMVLLSAHGQRNTFLRRHKNEPQDSTHETLHTGRADLGTVRVSCPRGQARGGLYYRYGDRTLEVIRAVLRKCVND